MKTILITLFIAASFSSFASVRPFYRSTNQVEVALKAIGDAGEVYGLISNIEFDTLESGEPLVRVYTDSECYATVKIIEQQPTDQDGNPVMGPTKHIAKYLGGACAQN